jgi:hypothetical protein
MTPARFFVLVSLWLTVSLGAAGQERAAPATSVIRGRILQAGTGQALAGAKVAVRSAGLEAQSAEDGSFELRGVPPGERTLEIAKEGFNAYNVDVSVPPGKTLVGEFPLLKAEAEPVEQVVIVGEFPRDTQEQVFKEREEKSETSTIIGGEQIRQTGKGDVGEIVESTPGVTLRDDKFPFIRGLGERYSQTLVNRASIPSPEPDKRAIPLDLFPASLVESVVIQKTYSVDLPAEFAGGSVQIRTKDVPEEPFFKVDFGLRYVDGTTFQDFRTYDGGNFDAFTFDDGTRDLPDEIPPQTVVGGDRFSNEDIQRLGREFNKVWEPDVSTAPMDFKLGMSFGRKFESSVGNFGVVGAINWANKYQNVEDEIFRVLKNFGSEKNPDPQVFNDFKLDTSTFESEFSALLNFTYEINPAQKVGIHNLYTRSFSDRVREQEGIDGQQGRPIEITQLKSVERGLLVSQLWGEHLLEGDILVDWRAGYGLSQRDEPDNRQVRYDFREAVDAFVFEGVGDSGRRDYFQLDENIYDGGLDFSIPFEPFVKEAPQPQVIRPNQKIQVGGAVVYRDRDFDSRSFRYAPSSVAGRPVDVNGNPIDLTLGPEELFRDRNINPNGFVLQEDTQPTDTYEAEQLIAAGYGRVDVKIFEPLRVDLGIRVENSDQDVTSFELFGNPPQEVETSLDTTDFLPAINVTYRLLHAFDLPESMKSMKNMQLRFGASRTVSRPEFRELAPFQYTDVAQGYQARGNPDLDRALIWNVDLGVEWFPEPGEVLYTGVFYKRFEDPIEQVIIPTGSALLSSWENSKSADLYGIEFEVQKRLGFVTKLAGYEDSQLHGFLKDLKLLLNYAVIESEVRSASNSFFVATNDERPLQGQPDYSFNAGLLYDNPDLGLVVSVLANTFGESVSSVGAFGLPDEEEQSRWSLDLAISKKLGNSTIQLTAQNLLDDEYKFEQGQHVTREYKKGFTVALSYSINFGGARKPAPANGAGANQESKP